MGGGRQAAALLVAAGALTLVNDYLPGSEHLDLLALNLVGGSAVLLGLLSWYVPWSRMPRWATLVHVPLALALIAVANLLGGVSAYSYATYYVVLFVWVGLAHPPGTAWLLVPPTAFAYVAPLLSMADPPVGGVSSVTVAVPVCVLVAETISRTTRRREEAQREAMRRAELSEKLVAVVADVNAVLDPEAAIARICDGVRRLVGAAGAAYVVAEGGVARLVEVAGLPPSLIGSEYPVSAGSINEVLRTGRRVVVDEVERYPVLLDELRAAVPGLHEFVAVPVTHGGSVTGALYAMLGAERGPLTPEEGDALDALAGHVGPAVRNAATYAEVVRQQAHEQAVIDGMADGMAVVGPDGLVRSWNAAAERQTGIAARHAVGYPLPFEPGTGDVQTYRTPDGTWLETVASPLADGEIVVGIRDVTKAKALDEAKDLFLATTSHELRTPLTVVKGFTHTLRNRWRDMSEEMRDDALRAIADRTDALIGLVDHLLLGAKAGAGRDSLAPELLPLEPVLREAVQRLGGSHPIGVETEPGLAVLADRIALTHVVEQLLSTAVKFSPAGAPVDVRARRCGSHVSVTIADRGAGLPPGTEEMVFERFVQAQQGDRRPFGGVGLGLHIVRTLVEAMQGEVGAAAREGGGAEFTLTVPAADAAVPAPRPAGSAAGAGLGGGR